MLIPGMLLRAEETVVTLDSSVTYQEIEGFGASLTDSSAYLLQYGLTASARSNLLIQLFCPTNGAGLNFLRQPIGASDFRLQDYTYDDMPVGQTDYAVSNFSIAYDEEYTIPLLQQIAGLNTNLCIMGTPWSPPAWMKDSRSVYYGSLMTNAYSAYAVYLRKYIQAYTAHGLPIHSITLQNEPLYEPETYAGSYMSPSNQIELIKRVGRDFSTNGISTRILVYDHNWDQFNYPITVLNDAEAAVYAAGSAFHAYAGDVSVQSLVHDVHPDKDIYFTECSSGDWSGSFSNALIWDVQNLIIGALRNWSKTVIKWNLALDRNGGPKIDGGCDNCRGLVTINTNDHTISTNSEYYALSHASRFLHPGARRIEAVETTIGGPYTVAFVNADESMVVIACNPNTSSRDFTFRWKAQSFSHTLPPKSVGTFTWPNVTGTSVDLWMTTADQSNLMKKQDIELAFHPASFEWKGRLWNVRDGRGDPDENRWSAQCVHVDSNDQLRLEVKMIGGTWYCGGVESVASTGHGVYRWKTAGRPDAFESNAVASLGTYSLSAPGLEMAFSRDYDDYPTNIFYTVEPDYLSDHRYGSAHSFTGTLTTHEFRWTPRQVQYRSWYGHTDQPSASTALIDSWTYEGTDVPPDTNEVIRMLMWMFNGSPPVSSQELVLSDFSYEPATGTLFSDDFEDGILSNIWMRFSDTSGTGIVETNGRLRISTADENDDSVGVHTGDPVSWKDDGLTYTFCACLSTISVMTARSAGDADMWAYQGIIGDAGVGMDPYAASNAATLRAGYDASSDQLTLEFLTKQSALETWGTSRLVGTIAGASVFFSGSGIDLRISLTYSNYAVSALYQGNQIAMTVISGSATGTHNLGTALYTGMYCVGAQNNEDGRGRIQWDSVQMLASAELPSMLDGEDDDGPGNTLVQLGAGGSATLWKAPIDTTCSRHRSQVLYRSGDIGRSGSITQLLLNVLGPPALVLQNYTIRLQHTAMETIGSTFINTGWTTVHIDNVTIPADERGWYAFNFSTSFAYTVQSNLLIDFVFQNQSKKSSPVPATSYSATDYKASFVASADRGDPFTWTGIPSGKKYVFNGNRIVDIRLAFPNEPPPPLGENLSFDDGAEGFLTNVPAWRVRGSVYAGAIRSSVALHGRQSLKLWKNGGDGHQSVYQTIQHFSPGNEYTLSGFILSESGEPFSGSGAYGAIALEWYGSSGLLRTDLSAPFEPTNNTCGTWHPFTVSAVPPAGTASGAISCALFSSPDQEGSLYFDHLSISATPAAPGEGGVVVPRVYDLLDEFGDAVMSNCWIRSGDAGGAVFKETNGCFRIRPGTNWAWQTSGYVTAEPVSWSNSNAWHVFTATLSTITVDSVSGGNDIETLLALCSEQDNPWWATNAVGLYGYYNAGEDSLYMQLLTKSDAPQSTGTERFNGLISGMAGYTSVSNGVRISIALGEDRYELRFNDGFGQPIPVGILSGSPSGAHNLGNSLTNAFWYVGAQNDNLRRATVYWDSTAAYSTYPPTAAIIAAAQTSQDGSGIVTITNQVSDPNGDECRLRLEASTNSGASWFFLSSESITSSLPASLATTQQCINILGIQTTNSAGTLESNRVVMTWNTRHAGLDGVTLANVCLRLSVDDGDVGFGPVTGTLFTVDNEAPSPASAAVFINNGAAWTFNPALTVTWAGFSDAGSEITRYYISLSDHGGTSNGTWVTEPFTMLDGTETDVKNTVYVWAMDAYGNIGAGASSSIAILTENADFDDDGYSNMEEDFLGTDPVVYTSRMLFNGGMNPTNQDVFIQWNSVTGRLYSVYYTDRLEGDWQPVDSCTNLPGSGTIMSCMVDIGPTLSRYYRIRISRD